jgi:hypothetical protein
MTEPAQGESHDFMRHQRAHRISASEKRGPRHGAQMNGYGSLSMIGSMPKKSLSTDSAVQQAPSTQAWSLEYIVVSQYSEDVLIRGARVRSIDVSMRRR